MSIYEKLYSWQQSIVNKFKHRESFGLFLDMGLGKTPISLAFAEVQNSNKILVVTINSKATEDEIVSGSWLWWAKKSSIPYTFLNKWSDVADCSSANSQLLIINYESTFKIVKNHKGENKHIINPLIEHFIKSSKNQTVTLILDESHKVKNLSSVQTKTISKIKTKLKLSSKSLHTYLLSGTPFVQGYIDLYSQLKMLGYGGTKATFKDQFCEMGRVPGLLDWQQPIVGYKNVDKLYEIIHRYALTIMSDDVIDLPEQTFVYHKTSQTILFRMLTYKKMKANFLNTYLETRNLHEHTVITAKNVQVNNPFYRNLAFPEFDWFAETAGTYWLRARQASIGFQGSSEHHKWFDTSRFAEIKQFMSEHRENYIVFYNFTPELIMLYQICEELKYKIDVYCGEIKSLHFYEEFSRMSDDERVNAPKRVILANFASGSTGMNWQLYNNNIVASIPLYKDYAQSLKRTHRIGQNKTVFYHFFYQDNWLDKSMLETLKQSTDYNTRMFESEMRKAELLENSE